MFLRMFPNSCWMVGALFSLPEGVGGHADALYGEGKQNHFLAFFIFLRLVDLLVWSIPSATGGSRRVRVYGRGYTEEGSDIFLEEMMVGKQNMFFCPNFLEGVDGCSISSAAGRGLGARHAFGKRTPWRNIPRKTKCVGRGALTQITEMFFFLRFGRRTCAQKEMYWEKEGPKKKFEFCVFFSS